MQRLGTPPSSEYHVLVYFTWQVFFFLLFFFFFHVLWTAFKLQESLSHSISLTCLNCGLIESKIVFRKCSSGHVCTGSQCTNGTPHRHCAGHSPSCAGPLGEELCRCALRLFLVRLRS